MPDSPRCLECLKKGKLGHMFKIAGRQLFKCHDCGTLTNRDAFDPIAFMWNTNEKEWKSWIESKGVKFAS